ncbi:UNVERIFIED_CONTAM: Clathrin interactor EPSIN 3 [Sesamum calycinum]|uniref:Clathrin interactor EPSIN 3 n=1 Tax=Sesamum calycinum TaxID=2727403 RepID=A0AAW2QLE6_9LAMI
MKKAFDQTVRDLKRGVNKKVLKVPSIEQKTLSDFQYIDSSGKDQGNNVRKKSQSLVVLVNDKERIQEVRQKAAANRDKDLAWQLWPLPCSYVL